jgi:putative membrane-bound dehydrogenase-like protein
MRFAAHSLRVFVVALLATAFDLAAAPLVDFPQLGLRATRGFRVTLFSDSDLANDIYAMTIDPRGNVVVTSQGYIRTLFDRNGDGVADDAEDFAPTRTGGMGLCFDGNDLLFCGDGGLWRFTDANGDGRADGPPTKLFSIEFGEHGGHAPRRGPDGWWYLIGGNDSKFSSVQVGLPSSPNGRLEGGALLRFGPGGQALEAVAQGFRNPYDFDFNDFGDLFTYDSDCERDYFLPWYVSTRLYHIAPGGHHGWRLEGYTRSWPRPDYSPDTVDILARLGRGSPTGVVCYRHTQFPPYFHNGLFALDWTFGRVWFLPHQPLATGSTYAGQPEVFLEPIGNAGFAPTDAVVAPDGSLLISVGGRKTRGAICRVQYVAEPGRILTATNWQVLAASQLLEVIDAPQPLDEWSRAIWLPIARRVGPEAIATLAVDNRVSAEQRSRAIELLTELFGGLPAPVAAACAQSPAPVVRARTAWSMGRVPAENFASVLVGLSRDVSPYVRTHALEALRENAFRLDAATFQQALALNLAYADKRVHQGAAALATVLPDAAFRALWTQQQKNGHAQARLTLALASLWRSGAEAINTNAIEALTGVLAQSKVVDHQLQAVRLLILALGDYRLRNPSVEVFTGYQPAYPIDTRDPVALKIRKAVTPLFPSSDAELDLESSRLLAMLEADDPALPEKLLGRINDRSAATSDFHYLAVLARQRVPLLTNSFARVARAILALDKKLDALDKRPRQNWSLRLGEVLAELLKRDPKLAEAVMREPDFTRPGNLPLAVHLGSSRYVVCARIYLGALLRDPAFPWSTTLIDLLSVLPAEETFPLLRRQWSNLALRDRLLIEFGHKPEAVDRDKFITGLSSGDAKAAAASVAALLQLPRDGTTRPLVPVMRLLRNLVDEPKDETLREKVLALINRETGQPFKPVENAGDTRRAYQPIFDWFAAKHPSLHRELDADDREDPVAWSTFYKTVPWTAGDAARGEAIFEQKGCQTCHLGPQPIGPDLGGVTSRFSPADLFNSIIFPNRDVAAPYRTTTFRTRDGSVYTGMPAFESADGVILQLSASSTIRLAESDIVSRQPSTISLMPAGLLRGLSPRQFADLYAYLKALPASR